MQTPPIHYTDVRGGWVAYQTAGEGTRDFVYVPGFIGNLDLFWESPYTGRFFMHIASHGRLICLDRRGCGLSDRLPPEASIVEEWAYDALGVMDAVGSERATLIAFDTGTPFALFMAAAHPDRIEGLILLEAHAVSPLKEQAEEHVDALADAIERYWGSGMALATVNPESARGQPERWRSFSNLVARFERASLHKGEVRRTFWAMASTDVREALPSVRVPALLVHSARDANFPIGGAREIAAALGARLVELDSADAHGWMNMLDIVLPAIDEFVGADHDRPASNRVLATVLFSDIVASTERAVTAGDRAWRSTLDMHDGLVRSCVEANEGKLVKSTGDGVLATFDGPAKAIRASLQIRSMLQTLGLEVYQGLHAGEIDLRGEDVSGVAVHIAHRVQALAGPGEVLVTRTVKDLVVGSNLGFASRGQHELKGVPETWEIYEVAG